MASKILAATSLTGGVVGSLDNIPSSYIEEGDLALVNGLDPSDGTTRLFYLYRVELTTAVEDSPYTIKPDDVAAGNKRWILKSLKNFTNDIELQKNYKVNTEYVKAIDTDGLKLYNTSDEGIYINNSGNVYIDQTLTVSGATTVNSPITSTYTGSAPFIVADNTMVTNLNSNYLGGVAKTGYLQKTEFEKGTEDLSNSSISAAVVFGTEKSDTLYQLFTEISNTTDTSASTYSTNVFNKQTTGFSIRFSDALDSANYKLNWLAVDF